MANKYAVGSGDWNSATLWKTTSGGATATTQPTASDDVFFDAFTGNVAINASTCITRNLVCTGHTGTLTFTAGQTLQVNSTLTFVAGMTIAGTGKLKLGTTSATITSGGKTISGDLEIVGSGTKTLSGAWVVTGLFSVSGSTGVALNGSTLTLNGGMSLGQTVTGTTTATLTGGSLVSTLDGAGWGLTTSYAGNITIGDWGIEKGTHTYTSGTITHTATKTLHLCGGNACTPTINWGTNIRIQKMKLTGGRATFVITGTMYVDDDLDLYNGGIFSITSGTMAIAKSIIQTGTGVISFFTTSGVLTMVGTGTVNSINCYGNFTINTAGTITFPAAGIFNILYSSAARTFTYTAGTVVVESGHQLRVGSDATYLNTGTIVWDDVTIGGTSNASVAYLSGNFNCNTIRVRPFTNSNSGTAVNEPKDTRTSVSLRIYNTYTLTINTAFYAYRGISTVNIRANSGTAYIQFDGAPSGMDLSNVTWGAVSTTLEALKPLVSWGGSLVQTIKRISIMNENFNKGSAMRIATY
jgi:hypothetical protein